MQNISSLASILWELLKKDNKSQISLIKYRQFFNPISAPRQKFKNLVGNFFGINMRSLHTKFHPYGFKTEEGDMEYDKQTYCKNAKFQAAPYGTKILLLIFAKLALSLQY